MLDDDAARLRLEEARDLWAVLHDDYPRDDAIARATAWVNHRIGMLDGQPAPSADTEEGGWFSATDVEALMNAAGKTARVRGRIQEINLRAGREELTFLDFGREREAFTAIIHRNVLSAFTESFGADLDGLAGRDVEVSGLIALYRGKPQMALRDPGAIMVVPSKTTPPATARTGDLDATDLVALRAAAGREVTVRGFIKRVGESRTRTLTFLDFEDHNRQKMSGIIHQDDLHRIVEAFGGHPKEALLDREITITGRLYLHRENPNIRITESGQIRVISGR